MSKEDTKHDIAKRIVEKVGGDPEDERYLSDGGTVTRETLDLVNSHLGGQQPDGIEDTKHVSARMAIQKTGGSTDDDDLTSRGGTVTKKALQLIDEALSDED